MIDLFAFDQSVSSLYGDEDDVERRYVFVGKWQHFFDGRPTWSETRWVVAKPIAWTAESETSAIGSPTERKVNHTATSCG